jgi:hypothetical protein
MFLPAKLLLLGHPAHLLLVPGLLLGPDSLHHFRYLALVANIGIILASTSFQSFETWGTTALPVGAVDDKPLSNYPRGVLAMSKLVTLALALALLGASTAATAATMSCFVDTPADDRFTPNRCFGVVPGAKYTTAVFRVDAPLPENFEVVWSDSRCNPDHSVCSVPIQAFLPKTMKATVLDLDTSTFFKVSATASFEDGR